MGRHRAGQPRRTRAGRLTIVAGAIAASAAGAGTVIALTIAGPQAPSVLTTMADTPIERPGPAMPATPAPTAPAPAAPAPAAPSPTGTTSVVTSLAGALHGLTAAARPAGTYRVVGLGDSVPSGQACGCTTFVSLAGQQLAGQLGFTPAVADLAESGLDTSDLIDQLTSETVRDQIAGADLVIIMVGANDFDPTVLTTPQCQPLTELPCYQQTFAQQRANLTSVLTEVTALTAGHGGKVVTAGYWNVFLDGAAGRARGEDYVTASDAVTQAENALIAAVSQQQGIHYADVYTPFKGDGTTDDTTLLAPDGDHPNAAGHGVLARAIVDAVT